MSPRPFARAAVTLALLAAGCGGGAPTDTPDASTPAVVTAGQDLDANEPRALSTDYALPPAFDDALRELQIDAAKLTFPDIGLGFGRDATRLQWTDLLRHEGKTAPRFGYTVAADVKASLATADPAASARELLAAQSTLNHRDRFERARFDRAYSVSTAGQPLVEALKRFYARPPVAGDPAPAVPPWESVEAGVRAAAAQYPPATAAAIALCIDALVDAAALRDEAFTRLGTMTLEKWATFETDYRSRRGTADALTMSRDTQKALDFAALSRAGQLAVRAVESLRVALKDAPPSTAPRIDLAGPLGRVVLALDATDDRWESARFFLAVDGGGNDTWLDDVATNRDLFHPVSAVLDLAGDDKYVPSFEWSIADKYVPGEIGDVSARQGAGLFGIGVLVDGAGNDTYEGTNLCQGYGLFGVGALVDRGGDDIYKGYVFAQGAAEFGYGLLLDTGGGKDSYETLQQAQGYGGARGIGWLVDDGGDDRYLAIEDPIVYNWANEDTNWSGAQGFGFGNRILPRGPYLSGGLGGLFDLAGNDRYQCAVMCQGFGYFFGTGLFYDEAGDDEHIVGHKYGIGGATHQSVGIFIDGRGADTYEYPGRGKTAGGEGVGLGYDHGVGYHIDRGAEKDVYRFPLEVGYIMGYTRFPSLGVLINEGGDDEYHIAGKAGARALGGTEVYAGSRSVQIGSLNTISLGMFLDLGGKDTYDVTKPGFGNGQKWIQRMPGGDGWDAALDHGYGFDSE